MINEYIKEFERETGARVVYITKSGSKLYGTDTQDSDTDYKGIFIPSKESILMKTDVDSYVRDSNQTNTKNSNEDIDFTLHSVYQFFNQLVKSETGSVDVLFSMFRDDTIEFEDREFTNFMRENYSIFLNKNMKSFIGYALGQTKKFGIKGARYDNLTSFIKYLETFEQDRDTKMSNIFKSLDLSSYKYIKMTLADGPKTSNVRTKIEYISVLGKLFHGQITLGEFIIRIKEQEARFGNRTKAIANTTSKTDFKALSHSLRIALEVKELLETNFIRFPLRAAIELREIKQGNCDIEEVVSKIGKILSNVDNNVDNLLLTTKLPQTVYT